MTKREMIEEMIEGLNYCGGNEKVIENRMLNTTERVEEVYNVYLRDANRDKKRAFYINVLTIWDDETY